MGFPIRKSPDQSLFSDSPKLIAASHVLHRLPTPRHPPYALSNLTIKFGQDKMCRYLSGKKDLFKLSKNSLCFIPHRGFQPYLKKNGGADQDRTGDLRRAKPALSQLSYSPISNSNTTQLSSGVGGPKWI